MRMIPIPQIILTILIMLHMITSHNLTMFETSWRRENMNSWNIVRFESSIFYLPWNNYIYIYIYIFMYVYTWNRDCDGNILAIRWQYTWIIMRCITNNVWDSGLRVGNITNNILFFFFLNVLMDDLGLSCMGLKIEHISKMQLKLGKLMLNHQRMGNGIPYLQTKPNMEGITSRILES